MLLWAGCFPPKQSDPEVIANCLYKCQRKGSLWYGLMFAALPFFGCRILYKTRHEGVRHLNHPSAGGSELTVYLIDCNF